LSELLTVTDVVEYAFCPIFTYFGNVLSLKQYEQRRGTIQSGRKLHETHEKTNRNYVPDEISGKKLIGVKLYSKKLGLVGKIDEAIETEDQIFLIERKFTDSTIIGKTLKVQIGLLSMLIEENVGKPVKTARIIFQKEHRNVIDVPVDSDIQNIAQDSLLKVKQLIKTGIMPDSKFDNRCIDCCFRRICPVGSLNTI
jgi:CRISPR-associated exonuclease Cas4